MITRQGHGIGIPADSLDGSSTCSRRSTATADGAQGGLGIGLALVRRLVEMHGGTVAARSEGPGRGTEIRVRLPLTTATLPADEAEPARRRSTPRRCRRRPARRILVADDNRDAAGSLALRLELAGHEVRTAHDGARGAGRRPRRSSREVVLLDLGMPAMDGYETARQLRRRPGARGAPDRAHRLGAAAGSRSARPRPASTPTW